MGGSSSQLGILARLSVLDASIALSALLLLLQSSRTFLYFSVLFSQLFCIGGIESAFWIGLD